MQKTFNSTAQILMYSYWLSGIGCDGEDNHLSHFFSI